MPLGQGIVEVLRAIPPRIEVTGHGSTVRVTAGSFDAALDYARQRFDAPAVLDCSLRHRLWPRVTLTVTTDPGLAASAPALEALRRQVSLQQAALRETRQPAHRAGAGAPGEGRVLESVDAEDHDAGHGDAAGWSTLEEIFAGQERRRQERAARIPTQRRGAGS